MKRGEQIMFLELTFVFNIRDSSMAAVLYVHANKNERKKELALNHGSITFINLNYWPSIAELSFMLMFLIISLKDKWGVIVG